MSEPDTPQEDPGGLPGARVAVCPGSFDPVTSGHLDIVRRAAGLFDTVVVAVVHNPSKHGLFSTAERAELIRRCVRDDESSGALAPAAVRVEVVEDGLLARWAREQGAVALVKGLRSGTDFAYELPMAHMNRHLSGIETVFVPGDPRYEHVSSSLVKEVARLGGDVAGLVPDPVLAAMLQRLRDTP